MSTPLRLAFGALLLAACGRSPAVGPTLSRISPASATNDTEVVVEIGARDVAMGELPRVYLDELELDSVTARDVDTVTATVPAAIEPGPRRVYVVMPDGRVSVGDLTFTVLAPGAR